VPAGGVQILAAEVTGVVGPDERGDHQVAGLEPGHLGTDVFDDPEELMTHGAALVGGRHAVIGMQVAAADRRPQHADHSVGGLVELRVGPVLDADVAGTYITAARMSSPLVAGGGLFAATQGPLARALTRLQVQPRRQKPPGP
jgi:hypothetical protein